MKKLIIQSFSYISILAALALSIIATRPFGSSLKLLRSAPVGSGSHPSGDALPGGGPPWHFLAGFLKNSEFF